MTRGGMIFCPTCGCPIQKLADNWGIPRGTLKDALDKHNEVIHLGEQVSE